MVSVENLMRSRCARVMLGTAIMLVGCGRPGGTVPSEKELDEAFDTFQKTANENDHHALAGLLGPEALKLLASSYCGMVYAANEEPDSSQGRKLDAYAKKIGVDGLREKLMAIGEEHPMRDVDDREAILQPVVEDNEAFVADVLEVLGPIKLPHPLDPELYDKVLIGDKMIAGSYGKVQVSFSKEDGKWKLSSLDGLNSALNKRWIQTSAPVESR